MPDASIYTSINCSSSPIMPEPASNLEFEPKLAMKTTWATNEYPHLGFVPLFPRLTGMFSCLRDVNPPSSKYPLVAYDGAITMEPILSYFKIGTSWKGDLWACPLCFVSHPYLARHYLNVNTLCHLHSATRDCIVIGVRQTRSWSAREMPSIPSWPPFPISYFASISLP